MAGKKESEEKLKIQQKAFIRNLEDIAHDELGWEGGRLALRDKISSALEISESSWRKWTFRERCLPAMAVKLFCHEFNQDWEVMRNKASKFF